MLILYIALGVVGGGLLGGGYILLDSKKIKREVAAAKIERAKQAEEFYQIKSTEMLNYRNNVDNQFVSAYEAFFVGHNCGNLSEEDMVRVNEVFASKTVEQIVSEQPTIAQPQQKEEEKVQPVQQEQKAEPKQEEVAKEEPKQVTKAEPKQQAKVEPKKEEPKQEVKAEPKQEQKAEETSVEQQSKPSTNSVWQSQPVTDTQQPIKDEPQQQVQAEQTADDNTIATTTADSQPTDASDDVAKKNPKTSTKAKASSSKASTTKATSTAKASSSKTKSSNSKAKDSKKSD